MAGHAQVPRRSKRRWPAGEIHQTWWDFRALVERGAAAIVQADAAVVGGISEWRRIAGLCAAFDLPMAPHWHHNLHVHLAACTPNCIVVEHFDLAKDVFNFERLLTPGSRALPEGGFLPVPSGPGLGIEFDAEAIERFRLP
ncbi:MAG: enolase C-terminal domain-like protein [Rubrivivax sp.]